MRADSADSRLLLLVYTNKSNLIILPADGVDPGLSLCVVPSKYNYKPWEETQETIQAKTIQMGRTILVVTRQQRIL